MPKNTVNPELTPSIADTLRRAADYIDQHGHEKFDYFASGTRRTDRTSGTLPAACAIGAISYAAYGRVRRDPWGSYTELYRTPTNPFSITVLWFEDFVCAQYGNSVSGWNDHPDRTADDVIQSLRAAAEVYDMSHGGQR
ncbi:hypothetical protein Dvina_45080 [Dactylosporangium vinaceum]|uniref:Uncharacterized protein n=1 Tax=Dactylosporangium vinaceum TaxID=53362 RepID=A0ABV5MIK8_9ACTN|nr:hypothetical protein [Dactylosporangium vinaceum]UAB95149.1 hypothetical protein Dvina_45080 [Dactylosporangium vinaceum]